jgi:cyclophilin family peptidyl-prolyl cis-trans isomerase
MLKLRPSPALATPAQPGSTSTDRPCLQGRDPLALVKDRASPVDTTGGFLGMQKPARGCSSLRRSRVMCGRRFPFFAILVVLAADARAQPSQRLAILQAEQRGATTAADLATIRAGARSADSETLRVALRALGRLGRPALVPDIVPALRFNLPEVRAEAANAIGSALAAPPPPAALLASTLSTLVARLAVEEESNVRAVICETIGRLPYSEPDQLAQAERALLEAARKNDSIPDRLGVAKGLEALVRTNLPRVAPSDAIIEVLRSLAGMAARPGSTDPLRDARVRRLALDALITASRTDVELISQAADDPDSQVRRLAMRATWRARDDLKAPFIEGMLRKGLADRAAMVRIEALTGDIASDKTGSLICSLALGATGDLDVHVALVALDRLAACGASPEAVELLERTVNDLSEMNSPRGWHRAARALVSLAAAAPDRVSTTVEHLAESTNWAMRLHAAKAAAILHDYSTLEKLALDSNETVAEESHLELSQLAGQRPPAPVKRGAKNPTALNAADLRRLAAPRALVTIRGVGSFELALFTAEAPAAVLRFARLAESGYYNGRTIDRILPNAVIELRETPRHDSPADTAFGRDEIGVWPHVRGAVGVSDQTSDGGPPRMFIDLVDNPRFDHRYTVFAQVLNGLDVIDDLLEYDIIDRIEIVP